MAGIRDDCQLSVRNHARQFRTALDGDKVVITARDQDGGFDRFQLVGRESLPFDSTLQDLGEKRGPLLGVGRHLLILPALPLDQVRIGGDDCGRGGEDAGSGVAPGTGVLAGGVTPRT